MEFLLLDIADLIFQSSYWISCLTVKNHVAEKTGLKWEREFCQIKVGDLKKVFSLMFVRFLHWRFFNIIHEILKNVKRKIIVIYLHSTFSVFSLRIFYVGPKNS